MFVKAKVKVWVVIILICGILYKVPAIISHITREIPVTEYSVGIDIDDVSLKNRIAGQTISTKDNFIELNVKNDEQDFIITESSHENKYPEYEKIEGYLYTPLVMFINNNVVNYNDNLTFVEQDSGKAYMKDIRYLLQAIESDKTWKDIGFDEHLVGKEKDPVKFIIPNEYDSVYPAIRDYIVLALNDFRNPTMEELKELEQRADIILAKCEQMENISGVFKSSDLKKGIFLYKESVISEYLSGFESSWLSTPYYFEISPGKTKRIEYDVYLKKDKAEEIKNFIQSKEFLEIFGLRNTDTINITQSKYYKRCFKVIDAVKTDIPVQESH